MPESATDDLIRQGEGQALEFKTGFAETKKAIESLCAFKNAQGGTVLIGVSPDGKKLGVTIGANTLESFANDIRTHTDPSITPTLTTDGSDSKAIVLAKVEQFNPGVLYFAYGAALVRVGPTNQKMSPEDLRSRLLPTAADDLRLGVRIYDNWRLIGGADYPAIMMTVSVENFANRRNSFVDSFDVIVEHPFEGFATRYEYRDGEREHVTKQLPINIPAGGISERLTVMAFFDRGLASDSGTFKIRIAAIGPSDFKSEYSTLAARIPA